MATTLLLRIILSLIARTAESFIITHLTYVLLVMPPSFVDRGRFLIFLMCALSDSVV